MNLRPIDLGGAAAILAILAASFFLGVKPQLSKAAAYIADEDAMRRSLSESGSVADREARMERNMETLTEALAAYERQMPASAELDAFMRQLGEVARDSGLAILRVQPGATVEHERYSVLPVAIDGQASFQSFYRFLFKMADVPRINKVESMTVTTAHGGLDVRLTLHIFMSRQAA